MPVSRQKLYEWCSIPVDELMDHPDRRLPLMIVEDSAQMGEVMAAELADAIEQANRQGRAFRCIVPCGPKAWYAPFARMINTRGISMKNVTVFHMDECLDWQGNLLPEGDPHNFRAFMEKYFYGPVAPELAVPAEQRHFPTPHNILQLRQLVAEAPIDLTLGGWGQDGHIAYNQSRRHPYATITLEELRNSTLRVQENNWDTIMALAHRNFGAAYQFVPPMSVTMGLKECLSAKRVRLYSDTGAWKQTALRAALFLPPDPEYPMTLLQEHPDAMVIATRETASHPISEHPEWQFPGIKG
nr:hypothetical protein [bacterium]